MIERILSKVQAAEMRFLHRVYSVTLSDKAGSWEIPKILNVEPISRRERSQLRRLGHVTRLYRKDWRGQSCWLRSPAQKVD